MKRTGWLRKSRKPMRHRAKAKTTEAVKQHKDSQGNVLREVCQNNPAGDAEYKRRRLEMFDRQGGICALSGKRMTWNDVPQFPSDCTFDHQDGRGLGGSKRDDRIVKDGRWYNAAVRWDENDKKGSRNVPYLPEVQTG